MPYAGPTYDKIANAGNFTSACKKFGGGDFSEELQAQATHVVITYSSFLDPGEDWNQFDLYRGDELIATKTVEGY